MGKYFTVGLFSAAAGVFALHYFGTRRGASSDEVQRPEAATMAIRQNLL